jgi:MFS family permease
MTKGEEEKAFEVLKKFNTEPTAKTELATIKGSLSKNETQAKISYLEIFKPTMRLVLTIGLVVSVLQQITGINAVFFYAPMIFEQSGIGTNASFIQAVLVGVTNLVFTIIAMALIDRIGRKPLLTFGVGGIVLFMSLLAYGFSTATYSLNEDSISELTQELQEPLSEFKGVHFNNDVAYKTALIETLGKEKAKVYEGELITAAISMNPRLILAGILGFVACFAVSLGPVMWVLFSELFPLKIRGVAISFVGFVNSAISAGVQFIFPWELSQLGSALTFLIYGIFALIGLILVIRLVPETKGKSLEELEQTLTN